MRAIVWGVTGDRNRATRLAGRIGEYFAYLLIGLGIFVAAAGAPFNGIYLAIVGWFLAQGARAAIASTAFTERIDGITVADIMDSEPVTMPADDVGAASPGRVLPALPLGVVPRRRRAKGASSASCPSSASTQEITAGRPALEVARAHRRRRGRALARARPTVRSSRCSATSTCARTARSWPSTPTACCAAS